MPLQKSFSDQNHSAKTRVRILSFIQNMYTDDNSQKEHNRQWGRNKSFQGQQITRHNPQSKPLQEKPPIPVSTATKNKLSNFLAKQTNVENKEKRVINLLSSDDKENSGDGGRETHSNSQFLEERHDGNSSMPGLPKKTCPSTPASRLALPDLIGMSDVERVVEIISPDDRVEWDYSKGSSQDSTPFQGIRRAKKRARSSSPIASSPAYAKGEQPQLDPGSELWGRYSLNGPNAATPLGPSVPALAHLMQTSSPQPSKDSTAPRAVSSFRRANSCGTTFPKRRRVGGSDGDVFTEPANIGPSRLSVLIERVQECMTQPKPSIRADESSSPSHGAYKSAPSSVDDTSPITHLRRPGEAFTSLSNSASHTKIPKDACIQRQERRASVQANSSDYGDFDDDELDPSVLDALNSQPPAEVLLEARPPVEQLPRARTGRSSRSPKKTTMPVLADEDSIRTLPKDGNDDDDDEFGDFDDDVFGDLEQVVSQFDSLAPIMKPDKALCSVPLASKAIQKSDSDDEFGDDGIDENDFEAAVAATQSLRKSNDLLPVRTRCS
jgi:DNA replication ATP-dependent helicase Dna2